MKRIITLIFVYFFGINTFAQITETCATGTIELKADNHQSGTLDWEKSKDGVLWEKIQNAHDVTYTFETTEAAYYRAVNKFTSCDPQPSSVTFVQQPPVANAGQDRLINDTFVYLAANTALASTGTWTILEGAGGAFTDPTNPNDKFRGVLGNTYKLQWTLQNSCGTSSSIVNLNFVTNQYYSKIVIVDDTDTILSTPQDLAAGNYNITFSSPVVIDDQTFIVGMVGNGFLRKVNTVTQIGNTFTMTTSQGKLDDILENGGFDLGNIYSLSQSLSNSKNANSKQNGYKLLSSKPTRAEILSNPKFQQGVHYFVMGEKEASVAGMRLKKTIENTGDDNFHFDFLDKKVIDEPALGVSISLKGTMDFKPRPNVFYNRNIVNPIVSVSLDNASLVTNLTATLEVKGERELVNREFNLYNYQKIIAVMVGPLPVMITANVDLEGVTSVKVDGSIEAVHSINNTITTNAGIKYENGEWTNHYEDKIENTMDTSLDIKGSLTQTFEIGPKVSFKVYDIVGPYVGARLTEDFSIRASNHNVGAINWDATLDLGANASIGVRAEVLGTTLFDCNQPLGNRSLYHINFPNSIEYVTGNNQKYSYSVPMPVPVKVRVMSNKGFPVPGAMVTFEPAGAVANNYVITDLNGYASTIWTATELGSSSLTATVQDSELRDIEGGPIVFNATEDASLVCVDSSLRAGYVMNNNKISPAAYLGVPPYTYSTDGVNFSSLIPQMDLIRGATYTATVRDINGCKASMRYYYPPLSCNDANLKVRLTAYGNNIFVAAQGGTLPYTYDLDRTGVFGTNEVFRAVSRGVHYITLKDAAGCTKDAGIYVTNSTTATLAYFSINNAITTAYSPISLSNLSNNATSYLWDFGDGTSSTEANPSKTYTSIGTYTISLTATNATIQNVFSKTITVTNAINSITEGLVGYYPFNGNANDESGNGNHGTVNGAILTSDKLGLSNKAMYFNSSNLSIPNSTSLQFLNNNSSWSYWIKLDESTNIPNCIWAKSGDNFGNLNSFVSINSDKTINNWVSFISSTITTVPNSDYQKWIHIANIFDGPSSQIKTYVNGKLITTDSVQFSHASTNENPLFFGYNGIGGSPWFFYGKLDDIRIYNRALSDSEVSQIYYTEYNPKTPTDGLVVHFPFNGNANDESGNNNHGTVNGATLTTDRFGNVGRAYNFNGLNDYIEISHSNSLSIINDISISTWINCNTINLSQRIIDKATASNSDAYMLDLRPDNKIRFQVANPPSITGTPHSNSIISQTNVWYHLVATYNGTAVNFYLNGILTDSIPISGTTVMNTNPIRIAANSILSEDWFNGKIDDIRIYNRALTDSEIQSLYNE